MLLWIRACASIAVALSLSAVSPGLRVSSKTRALVVSPHPDDAVLGAGGLIARIVARGGSVEIVEMTSGDGFPKGVAAVRHVQQLTADTYRQYGTLREREALRAMRQLGVPRSRLRLLGFPDEGLCDLAGDMTLEKVFPSPYTLRDSPPAAERIEAGAKYRAVDASGELADLIAAFRPSLVVLPDARDLHPDHCATHMLVHEASDRAAARGVRRPVFAHYVIHRAAASSASAPAADRNSGVLHLSVHEQAAKRRAIDAYRSQAAVMAGFLRTFEGQDEQFVLGETAPPAACWCQGSNIAAPRAKR